MGIICFFAVARPFVRPVVPFMLKVVVGIFDSSTNLQYPNMNMT